MRVYGGKGGGRGAGRTNLEEEDVEVRLEHLVGGRHLDRGLGVAEGEVEDLMEGGREGGVGEASGFYVGESMWELGGLK